VHIGISMGPTNTDSKNGPYDCGNPGSKYPVTSVGSCDWNLVPPANEFYWVKAGGN
jgi:hypothetical protein